MKYRFTFRPGGDSPARLFLDTLALLALIVLCAIGWAVTP